MSRRFPVRVVTLLVAVVAALPPSAPRAAVAAGAPVPTAGVTAQVVRGGDIFYTATGRCTVSFTVAAATWTGFLTAGRCGRPGDAVHTAGGALLGHFQASAYPTDDYAVVRLVAGWTALGEVRTGPGTVVAVKGSAEAPVGGYVCKYAPVSGWRCGVIRAKGDSVGGLTGLTRTSACSEAGDLAGPFLAGGQAQGLTVGASGSCASGGTTWFQPVNEPLARYGLRLVTS